MALQVKKGSFAAETSSGNKAYTGVGFTPKCLLFFATAQTATGFAAGQRFAVGWAAGSTPAYGFTAVASDDNANPSAAATYQDDDAALYLHSNASGPTIDLAFTVVSYDADGFTLGWADPASSAWIIHYIALGGSDLTNAYVGSLDCPAANGDQAITSPGFTPDCLLFLTGQRTNASNSNLTQSRFMLGAATSPSQMGAASISENEGTTTSVGQYQRTDKCIASAGPGGVNLQAVLKTLDTNGFTLTWDAVVSGRAVLYLALKGGEYKVGTETQKTSTGTKQTTGLGLTPSGLLLFGCNAVANSSLDATQQKFSIGAGSSGVQGSAWTSATDNLITVITPSDANEATLTTKVLRHATNTATTNAEADLALGTDDFTLDWTTADGTAREFIYLAFGNLEKALSDTATASDAVSLEPGPVKAETVTASESVSKEPGPALSDAVTASDALVVELQKALSDSVTPSEAVSKEAGPVLADSVTSTDALVVGPEKALTDSVTASEGEVAEVGKALSDSVALTDALISEEANDLTLGDSVTASDSQARDVEAVQADSVTATDASAREAGLGQADTVSVTDSLVVEAEHALTDSVTASDALFKDVETALADSVTATDAQSTEAAGALSLSDSVTATDSEVRDVELVLTDTATSADAVSSEEGNDLVLGDSVTVTDTDLEELGVEQTQSLSDSVTVTDSATPVLTTTQLPMPEGGWRPIYRQPLLYKLSLSDVVRASDELETEHTEGIPTRQQKRELVLLA